MTTINIFNKKNEKSNYRPPKKNNLISNIYIVQHLMSNSFLFGSLMITVGLITTTHLKGIMDCMLLHMRYNRYNHQHGIDNTLLISYYWNHFVITSIVVVGGVSF
jgi:hypothetical protein